MSKYPHLTGMGVNHPEHIDRYSVNSIGYVDVLRIVYERPQGSFLPHTRTYKFARVQQTVKDGSGEGETVMSSHPEFRAAVAELDELLCKKERVQDAAADIVEELRLLEEDIALRSECIKSLLTKIKMVSPKTVAKS